MAGHAFLKINYMSQRLVFTQGTPTYRLFPTELLCLKTDECLQYSGQSKNGGGETEVWVEQKQRMGRCS